MNRTVFISHTSLIAKYPAGSTFLEAAIAGVKEAGWNYDEMQRFYSSPLTPAEECRRRVSQCDAFVGILGFDWGSEPPDMPGTSYTKYEFQVAQERMSQRTVLFVVDSKTTAFPAYEIAAIAPNDKEKQESFRNNHGLHAKRVLTPEDLRREIADALRPLTPPSQSLEDKIRLYEDYINSGDFVSAWRYFRDDLNYKLDFESSRHAEHLGLILKLFPKGSSSNPALRDVDDIAGALNAIGRAYKNVGQPGTAIGLFKRQLALQQAGTLKRVMVFGNLANALRLTGRFSEAEDAARKMANEASSVSDPKWEAYSLYWNGVLLAGSGLADEAVLLLRQAQVLFEQILDKGARAAGLGRTYAHLAQLELWLENPRGALCYGQHAHRLAKKHPERREPIFASRLTGTAKLHLGKYTDSREDLQLAIQDARDHEYWEERIAATISLAELMHRSRSGSSTTARDLLNADLRDRARLGPYAMLLADFDIALCQILRDSGRPVAAVEAAHRAIEAASGVQSDSHYHWGIIRARKHLVELGEPQSEMPLQPPAKAEPSLADILHLSEEEKTKARLRAEFTSFFRMVTGHYRYAPSKFVRLLREDWSAIRSMVEGRDVTVQLQFVEIHVGHPCNLNCRYCRGELREKPEKEEFLSKDQMVRLINQIYRMNAEAFIRFSGLIGEPLLHVDIVDILETIGRKHAMRWGLTTNGVRLEGSRLLKAVLKARHVHISVDAGSNETYRTLKGGPDGTFDKVIHNIGELARTKHSSGSSTEIVVSFLLQQENYRELPSLAQELKTARVDSLEVKMQHYDGRRRMSDQHVHDAYKEIEQIQRELSDEAFHVVVVQSPEQAVEKVHNSRPIHFEKCYANLLGLSSTVDPTGIVKMCCQYYQRTLGDIGSIGETSFRQIWRGQKRQTALKGNPFSDCDNCSPSDDFVNRFVQFLKDAHGQDASFLDWVENEVREDSTNE